MVKKKHPKISKKSSVKEKPTPGSQKLIEISKGWMVAGFDISLGSVAGAAIAYDDVLKKFRGPAFSMWRFSPSDDYFQRLLYCAESYKLVLDLQAELGVMLEMPDIVISIEEPFPAHGGFTKRGNTQTLKQAAEMNGAFMGGLIRYGYPNIMQISNQNWRSLVAAQISEAIGEDVTTYPAKWRDPRLCARYGCAPKDAGKFRSQQWTTDVFEPWFAQQGGNEIPEWPPMIVKKGMKVPRPETSKAKSYQPDDRYDALAIMEFGRVEADLTN